MASRSCLKLAKEIFHMVLCGQDFSWHESKKAKEEVLSLSDTGGPMWLRILAICVQSGLHPLEHPLIATLSANYESGNDVRRRWSIETHIDVPQRILTTLGINIYSATTPRCCKRSRFA
jgi:hypothetical protein